MSKRKTKYGHVIHKLPRLLNKDPSAQTKIEAVKLAIVQESMENTGRPPTAIGLTQDWADLQLVKEELEAELSSVNAQIKAYDQLMVKQYEVEGIDSLRLESGEAPRIQYEPVEVVEDPRKFREWCLHNGYANAMTLPWQTRHKIVCDLLLAEEEMPDGVLLFSYGKVVKG